MNKNKEKTGEASREAVRDKKPKFLSLADRMIADLGERSKEIVKKRFGLSSKKGETLEKIGQHYGITRERVRQIISEAMKNVSEKINQEAFLEAEEKIIFTISKNGGIVRESEIIEKFNSDGPEEANAIRFFASCSKEIIEMEEKERLEKSWVLSQNIEKEVREVVSEAEKIIQKEKKLLTDKEIFEKLSQVFPGLTQEKAINYLQVSVRIKKNNFGRWGSRDWMEINPKGTREKVYLVLQENKKPLHFTEIAKLIDKFQLGKRKAHPQTVHNELIKDDRFILVGRGIYALREWGYFEGTIRDIIELILKKNAKPMTREEVTREVLKMRAVKKTTIMINLNNRKHFSKSGELYSLKK
jgi:DNA-directed RNA polymerase delta subunit